MMRIEVLSLYITLLSLCACKIPRQLTIAKVPNSDNISLTIESNKRAYSAPIIPFIPFEVNFILPDGIIETAIYNSDSNLLWKVRPEPDYIPIGIVEYGILPKRFIQDFPPNNAPPETLIRGDIYLLKLQTETGLYNKRFFYNRSVIYLEQ